jgi:hypothetical protein
MSRNGNSQFEFILNAESGVFSLKAKENIIELHEGVVNICANKTKVKNIIFNGNLIYKTMNQWKLFL